jgi:autotransporter-associated beta strand protein
MKKHPLQHWAMTLLIIASVQSLHAANKVWSAASGTDTNWSNGANWNGGVPGITDTALFFDVGETNNNTNITGAVIANTTVNSLRLGDTNGIHNLFINPGVTLTVTGTNNNGFGLLGVDTVSGANGQSTFFAGPWPGPGIATAILETNTISGPGSLVVNNTNNELMVRYCNSANVVHYSTLDLSQLANFQANLGRIGVGFGQAGVTVRSMGRLVLAQTNVLTLSGTNSADDVNLVIGSNGGNNDGNNTTAFLQLGQSNRINVDKILAGGQKTPGTIIFNTIFTNPSVVFRGSDGVGRVSNLRLGDESDAGATSGPSTGTLNTMPGTVDILADKITLGKSQNGNNSGAATGNLLLGAGNLDVNTLEMAAQFTSSFLGNVTGNATFSNTTVTVNTLLNLGVSAGAPGSRTANINLFSNANMTVNGSYKNQGTVNINITNSTLRMPTGSAIAGNIIQIDGGTLANAGTIKATNALNIYNSGTIAGTPIFDLGNNANPATWDVQAITNGSLTVGSAIQGKGTIYGNIIQAPGAAISPGGLNAAGTLTLGGTSGNLTLNDGGTLNFDLSTTGGGANDFISVGGALAVNGTNNVFLKSLGGSLDTASPYTLITSGTLTGNQTQFKVVGPLTTGRYTFAFDTTTVPNSVQLIVGGTGPANQIWVGDGAANVWDAQGAFNWSNGVPSQFFNLDNVAFNDSGSAAPAVSISGSLVAGSIAVNNSAKSYGFGGSGSLSVAGPVAKFGTGSLTISNTTDNTFSSLVTVSNGPVTFSNNGQNTFQGGLSLFGGSVTLGGNSTNTFLDPGLGAPVVVVGTGTTLTVANGVNSFNGLQVQLDGSLVFNQSADATFDGNLLNSGSLTKIGANHLTLLGNNSSFSGPVQINAGTVIAGNGSLPLVIASVTVTNNGALDINGANLGALPITISGSGPTGAGVLVNNGQQQSTTLTAVNTALQNLILAANATIGGSGPFNVDPIHNLGYFVISGTFSSSGTNFNLTKVGQNQVSLINATVDPALGNIDIQQGMLNFQSGTTSMGNPASNIIVRAGAELSFYDTTALWVKNFILFGDGVTPSLFNYSGASGTHTIGGPVTLNGNCVFGGRGSGFSMTFQAPIGGTGALIKATDPNTIILQGTNTYAGTTTVNGGTVLIEGISGTNNITVAGGTLGGLGLIVAPVTVQANGTLSPGDLVTTTATLVISNTLTLGGTNAMDVFKSGGLFTSDLITNVTSLTYGGTLSLNLTGDPLTDGDAIKLFSFNTASGSFAAFNPPTPGDGLVWNTSTLRTDGQLRVSVAPPAQPQIASITVSGGQVVISGTNGPNSGNYYVLASTNLALPLSSWTPIGTDSFVGGNFNFTNAVNPAAPRQFYIIQLP